MALKIISKGKHYSWQALKKKYLALEFTDNKNLIFYPTENSFLSTLYLLYGFTKKLPLIPHHDDYFEQQNKQTIAHIHSSSTADICLAIPTSGTQTKPKIALISRKNIIAHCQNIKEIIPFNSQSIWLNCLPLDHIASVMIIYRCLYHNATMVLNDKYLSQGFNPLQIIADIKVYNVTHISLVPSMLSQLLDVSATAPVSLKCVLVGGDKISDEVYQRAIKAHWPIYISYGMTEATSTIAIGKSPGKLKLLKGFKAKIGHKNTLKLKADMLISHYSDAKKLIKNDWFETNDIAEIETDNTGDSYIHVMGRNDQLIISGGQNISPKYIEELILSSTKVKQFISDLVISKQGNSQWGDTIVATFVGDSEKLKQWVKTNMKSCYQPRVFNQVDKISRTSLGKSIRF